MRPYGLPVHVITPERIDFPSYFKPGISGAEGFMLELVLLSTLWPFHAQYQYFTFLLRNVEDLK